MIKLNSGVAESLVHGRQIIGKGLRDASYGATIKTNPTQMIDFLWS